MLPTESDYKHRGADAGVTEPVIRSVVVAFYEKVKRDAALGPVFRDIIGENWDAHVERVCSFWLYVTHLAPGYNSPDFMPAHIKHTSIQSSLLPHWLRLFRETAEELCSREVAGALIDIAQRMAVSIEMSLTRRDSEIGPIFPSSSAAEPVCLTKSPSFEAKQQHKRPSGGPP